MRGDQLTRQWRILRQIEVSKNGQTAAEIADQCGVSLRTVYRDLDDLQYAGFPLYAEKGDLHGQRWKLMDTYKLKIPEPFTHIPPGKRTISLADGSITIPFLDTFGRPSRDTGLESDRRTEITEAQRMHMINSTDVNDWINKSRRFRIPAKKNKQGGIASIRLAWLTILSRYPTESEIQTVKELFGTEGTNKRQAEQDLIWALINTKEFLCRH